MVRLCSVQYTPNSKGKREKNEIDFQLSVFEYCLIADCFSITFLFLMVLKKI